MKSSTDNLAQRYADANRSVANPRSRITRKNLRSIVIIMLVASAIMYGEYWGIARVSTWAVACDADLLAGLSRALDAGFEPLVDARNLRAL